jgi:hypothetical protein
MLDANPGPSAGPDDPEPESIIVFAMVPDAFIISDPLSKKPDIVVAAAQICALNGEGE